MSKNATPTASEYRTEAIERLLRLRTVQPQVSKVKAFVKKVASTIDDVAVMVRPPDFLVPEDDGYQKSIPEDDREPVEITCHIDGGKKLDWGDDDEHRLYLYTERNGTKVLLGYVDVTFGGKVATPDLPTGVTPEKMKEFAPDIWRNFVNMELSSVVKPRQTFAAVVNAWCENHGAAERKQEHETLLSITRYSA